MPEEKKTGALWQALNVMRIIEGASLLELR